MQFNNSTLRSFASNIVNNLYIVTPMILINENKFLLLTENLQTNYFSINRHDIISLFNLYRHCLK